MGEIRQLSDEAEALQRRNVANVTRPKQESIDRRLENLLRKVKVKDAMPLLKRTHKCPRRVQTQ